MRSSYSNRRLNPSAIPKIWNCQILQSEQSMCKTCSIYGWNFSGSDLILNIEKRRGWKYHRQFWCQQGQSCLNTQKDACWPAVFLVADLCSMWKTQKCQQPRKNFTNKTNNIEGSKHTVLQGKLVFPPPQNGQLERELEMSKSSFSTISENKTPPFFVYYHNIYTIRAPKKKNRILLHKYSSKWTIIFFINRNSHTRFRTFIMKMLFLLIRIRSEAQFSIKNPSSFLPFAKRQTDVDQLTDDDEDDDESFTTTKSDKTKTSGEKHLEIPRRGSSRWPCQCKPRDTGTGWPWSWRGGPAARGQGRTVTLPPPRPPISRGQCTQSRSAAPARARGTDVARRRRWLRRRRSPEIPSYVAAAHPWRRKKKKKDFLFLLS